MSGMYSEEIRAAAVRLRCKGRSLMEIGEKLKIPKSTVFYWTKNVRLTGAQKLRLKKRELQGSEKGRKRAMDVNRQKIENWKKSIQNRTYCFSNMPFENPMIGKLVCGVLYLCEGEKYPKSRHLAFVNSDPMVIKLFLELLRRYFNADENKLRVRVLQRYDQNCEKLNKFWSKLTGVSLNQFYKNYVDKRTEGKPTKIEGYKGVCAIQYNNTSLQFELQSIGEAILNCKK